MEPDGISMIALPVNSALSYQPPNVYTSWVGVGNVFGVISVIYDVGTTTPAGNVPELVFNVILYDVPHHGLPALVKFERVVVVVPDGHVDAKPVDENIFCV